MCKFQPLRQLPADVHSLSSMSHRRVHRALSLWVWVWLGLAMALCGAYPTRSFAQNASVASEERVEAAYVFKFLNYVEWPLTSFAQADTPYVVGVMNSDNVSDALSKVVVGRTVNNRRVIVKNLLPGDTTTDIHVLFISQSDVAKHPDVLKQLQSRPVLVVTRTPGALALGAHINFHVVNDNVRFEISLDAAEKSGLKINARMLALATYVLKGAQ